MPRIGLIYCLLFFLLISFSATSQTFLESGDVAVLGVNTDLGGCGLPAESDEISFFFYKDLTTSTTFDMTDNGWENSNPGFWGDTEGTLKIWRTGATVPKGTIITFQAINNGGTWTYDIVSPNDGGWLITYFNGPGPGGPFNLEPGGDQVYFLQSNPFTPWNNQGGGGLDMASYNCRFLFAYNTGSSWSANGTTHQSNLHPDLQPCFHMEAGGADFVKYVNPYTPTNQFDWNNRIVDPANWSTFPDCSAYVAGQPHLIGAPPIQISSLTVGVRCPMIMCDSCAPYTGILQFLLPPGYFWNVVYTDGTNNFTLNNIENFYFEHVTITGPVTYSVVSATPVGGGCPLDPDFITSTASYNPPHHNAGTYAEITLCPDSGVIPLGFALGPHDAGGQWFPPLDPIFHTYYSSFWGPGVYHYVFINPGCPPDSASVKVNIIDLSNTIIEIGCDVNGTPTDITDDRMVVTMTVLGEGFSPTYHVWIEHYGVPTGTVTPIDGVTGEPSVFILDPGTATTSNLSINVMEYGGPLCKFEFPLPPPGFCSDPCDHDMYATITGDDEICLNGCPDNPALINIHVEGGTQPYKFDFAVTATGYPAWNFTDIPFAFDYDIEVCIDSVQAPIFDEGSGSLILPAFLTGTDVNITLLHVYAKYDCEALLDEPTHTITIHPLPPISTTSLSFCKGIADHIDLTDYDHYISLAYDVTWYDGDPLNGGDQIYIPSDANLLNVVQLWAKVEDDYCENSIQVPFTILPQPDLAPVPPQEICAGTAIVLQSIPLNDLGNSMATYTFHSSLPPDTSNLLNPLYYVPADSTTIYVLATAGMCYDTIPIKINVQDYPDFVLEATPCNLILDTWSVLFTSTADSIHATFGIVVNNPTGQDAVNSIPNDSTVIIELISASGLCKDTFTIVAPNCNCPLITPPAAGQPSYSICDDQAIPVFSVTVGGGLQANWYDVPSGGVPLLMNSLTYQPISATSAIYYAEAFDAANNCYSIRTQIPFTVNPVADLQMLADPVLCETQTIDFNTFIPGVLNGVGGTGQWFDLTTNQPVSGIIQPQNGNAWYYLFTSTSGSCISSDTLQATVNVLPSINVDEILCFDATLTYQVSFTSDADVVIPSVGGLSHIPGTDSFLLSNIPFDAAIQFDLQNTLTGCTASISQAAPNCSCPALLQSNSVTLCSNAGTTDLSAFEGPGATGSWQLVSTPPGSNPATLNGSVFQGQNKDHGHYQLRFIRSVILNDCIDTATFDLQLNTSPFADAGSSAVVCAPDVILLTGNAGGDNVVFNWQENGTGSISNPNVLNTSYTPTLADITAGSVSFTLTATDQTGFCPQASETITMTIDGSAYFIINAGTQVYCDTADTQVNFDDLISYGNTNGHWFFPDTVSAPITGSSLFNPSTLTAGTYTVFYTTNNAVLPCENDTVGVNLLIHDCACPSVALSVPSQGVCSESDVQNLNAFLLTTEPGTWSITGTPVGSKPATINGSNFVTNNSDKGTYHLRYTLSNPKPGCDDFSEIDLDVIATPSFQVVSVKCADDLQSWEAIIITSAENVTNTDGTLTSLGNDQYSIKGLTLQSNVQLTASNGSGLCTSNITIPSPDCACTLSISNLPDNAFLCPGETVTFDATVVGGKGSVSEFWIVNNDSLFQSSLEIGAAGTYQFVSLDSLGCKQEKFIDVNIYTEMVADATVADITCPGDRDGQIIINGIAGGNGPFFVSVNGGTMQPISFPHIINGLSAGNYSIELLDAFSCTITFNLVVQSVSSETLDLGPDQTILVGDSLFINPHLSFIPDSFYWQGDLNLLNLLNLDNWIRPEDNVTFELFALDSKGCVYTDQLSVHVLLTSSIYVPTVFSPNDDDVNDVIAPNADPSVTMFEYFEIYSRWGELVYSAKGFVPGQSNVGWDGTHAGKPVNPGVYVYRLSATNKKGKTLIQAGDITLLR